MIKNLKSYVCLTLLVSSFGSFANTLPCKQAAENLIQSMIDTKNQEDPSYTIPEIKTQIDNFNHTYPNSPRCAGYVNPILTIHNYSTITMDSMRVLRRHGEQYTKLEKLKDDISKGNLDPKKNHTTKPESAPKAEASESAPKTEAPESAPKTEASESAPKTEASESAPKTEASESAPKAE